MEGFILDQGDYGSQAVPTWHGGKPRKSLWTGVKKGEPQFDVRTLRCSRCGFLESYAK